MVHTATAAVLAAALCLLSPPAGAVSVPERPLMRQWVFDAASLLSPAARTGYGAGNEGHFVGLHGHKLTFGTCAPKPWEYKVVEVVEGAYNDTAWGLVFRASTSARKAMQSNFQKEILVLQARSGKSTQCVAAEGGCARVGGAALTAAPPASQVFAGAQDVAPPSRERPLHGVQPPHPGETAGAWRAPWTAGAAPASQTGPFQMLPPQEEALVEECSRQPVAQSYLDAILGQIMQQVPGAWRCGAEAAGLARAWWSPGPDALFLQVNWAARPRASGWRRWTTGTHSASCRTASTRGPGRRSRTRAATRAATPPRRSRRASSAPSTR